MTPEQRSLRARMGALASHLNATGVERTARARSAWNVHWAAEVLAAHPGLSDSEVARRAAIARKLWYAQLAYRSATSRAKRKAATSQKSVAAAPEVRHDRAAPAG